MWTYLFRRLLISVPVLVGITALVFLLITLAPGDPIDMIIPEGRRDNLTPEQMEALRASLGLDKPIPVRYVLWLREAVQGNLGSSYKWHMPVTDVLGSRLGATVRLSAAALLIALAIGIPAGFVMARHQHGKLDYGIQLPILALWSTPPFFMALGLIYIFALRLGWLPAIGMSTPGVPPSLGDQLKHIAMPAFALAAGQAAIFARYTRASVLDVMQSDFVTTARSKGLSEWTVVTRHIGRNAGLPVITILGLSIPQFVSGAVITETIFSWPGIGQAAYIATINRDYPMLMGVVVVTAITVLASNLITDVSYAGLDPRIRYD